MPTASLYAYETWTNLGPLTTTFTPAPACTASPTNLVLEVITAPNDPYDIPNGFNVECPKRGNTGCYPSGEQRQKIFETASGLASTVVYHSPGLYCPSGWTTAGTKVPGTTGQGLFAPNVYTTRYEEWGPENGMTGNYFAEGVDFLLGPRETLVVCCPSSYTANGAYCYSDMGPVTNTATATVCVQAGDIGSSIKVSTYTGIYPTTTVATVYTEFAGRVTYQTPLSELPLYTTNKGSTQIRLRNTVPIIRLIQSGGNATKDEKSKDEGVVSRPNAWLFIGMPFLVAGLGAVVGGLV